MLLTAFRFPNLCPQIGPFFGSHSSTLQCTSPFGVLSTLPVQSLIRKLNIIILMLARDHKCIWQLSGECVAGAVIDSVADKVGVIDARVADVLARAIFEVDDREEIIVVFFAVLGLSKVERALAGSVWGWRWRRGTGGGRRRSRGGWCGGGRCCVERGDPGGNLAIVVVGVGGSGSEIIDSDDGPASITAFWFASLEQPG